MVIEKARWGNKSQKIEQALLRRCRVYRNRRTGKRRRYVASYAPFAEKYDVSREFVRQVAADLGIHSLWRMKGRRRK